MPTCQNCSKKWAWKQTMKSLFKLKCPHCGKKQYESTSSRRKGAFFSLFPLIVIPSFGFTWILAFVSLIVMVAVLMLIYPFILQLSNEQEPLW